MNVEKERIKNFCVLKIEGRIDTSNAPALDEEIDQLISGGERNILLDCSHLKYISSSGLRVFLTAQKKTMAAQGKLHLCNMQPAIEDIFVISGFSKIFRLFNTQDEALASE